MYIHVTVKTHMKKESLEEAKPGYFAISVREKAERNAANARVIELIAGHFGITTGKVRIVNGHRSPSKLLVVELADE